MHKTYWGTKHNAYFPPEYPCVNSTLICNFPNPSPLVTLNDTPTILRPFQILGEYYLAEVENKSLCFFMCDVEFDPEQ